MSKEKPSVCQGVMVKGIIIQEQKSCTQLLDALNLCIFLIWKFSRWSEVLSWVQWKLMLTRGCQAPAPPYKNIKK